MALKIVIDPLAVEDLVNGFDGPVARYLGELSLEMTAIAIAVAPVQEKKNYSWSFAKSTSYEPWGLSPLKGRIRPHMGRTRGGTIFSGVNAPYGPTLFLERPPAGHEYFPFLTTALYAISI